MHGFREGNTAEDWLNPIFLPFWPFLSSRGRSETKGFEEGSVEKDTRQGVSQIWRTAPKLELVLQRLDFLGSSKKSTSWSCNHFNLTIVFDIQ